MTWQDELQHLDGELAAGRISADEYRRRRDALTQAQQGQAGSPSGGFQQPGTPSGGFQQPGQPAYGGYPQSNPFPPAFDWSEAAAAAQNQAAQNNPFPQGQQSAGPQDSTQVVNVGQQFGQFGQQQGWGGPAGGSGSGTPWGDSDMPPEHHDTGWMRQGPEVFEVAGKSSKGKLIAGLSLGTVLLAGVVAAGVIYFTSNSPQPQADGKAQGTNATQQATPTTSELPAPPPPQPPPATTREVLATVPGPPRFGAGPLDAAKLQGLLKPENLVDVAVRNGFTDGWFNGSSEGSTQTALIALRMRDEQSAKAFSDAYGDSQQGLREDRDLAKKGVDVFVTSNGTLRATYVVHNWAVIVEVIDTSGNARAAEQTFEQLLETQLQTAPPTIRE